MYSRGGNRVIDCEKERDSVYIFRACSLGRWWQLTSSPVVPAQFLFQQAGLLQGMSRKVDAGGSMVCRQGRTRMGVGVCECVCLGREKGWKEEKKTRLC